MGEKGDILIGRGLVGGIWERIEGNEIEFGG